MSYHIIFDDAVKDKDFPRLDVMIQRRIKKALLAKLVENPTRFGIPLRENLKGLRKLRVGDYRILFVIQENTVKILIIDHRSTVYQAVLHRLGL